MTAASCVRKGADLVQVRERSFDPTLPLLSGSAGTMPDVRVQTIDWASVIQAFAELQRGRPVARRPGCNGLERTFQPGAPS